MKTSEPYSSHRTNRSQFSLLLGMLFNLSSRTALLLGILFLFLLVKLPDVGYPLPMLFVDYPAVGSAFFVFRQNFPDVGDALLLFFIPPQVGGLTHAEAVVMHFSTGASAAISA